jgi:hypothetical protein
MMSVDLSTNQTRRGHWCSRASVVSLSPIAKPSSSARRAAGPIAVLMDAFVIRATLVPAFMRIAGEANWCEPRRMRRIHDRIGISEMEKPEPPSEALGEGRVAEPVGSR